MMYRKRIHSRFLASLLLAVLHTSAWSFNKDQDIVVHVQKEGQSIAVDVDCPVDAPWSIVWEVLTDYDHMAQFISNLEYSSVKDRVDNVLRVHQKGRASRWPLTLTFDNVREIELVPYSEIRSRLISGDLKASEFTTRIVELAAMVHIVNSGRYTPKIWVPPLIGPALIEAKTQKQFGEIRAEILRRSAMARPEP
jgi:Polyketide cyclase / dehydrase and lipid transport